MSRYEGGINNGVMKCLVGVWYLYALIATSSYAGEIRSFFINPGVTSPLGNNAFHSFSNEKNLDLDNLGEVVQSDLGWGLILYGEEEEKVMAASSDPVISKLWSVSQIFYQSNWSSSSYPINK